MSLYETCPYAWKLRYLDRHKPPSSEAMDRGTAIHTGIEHFLQGVAPLPNEALSLATYYIELKANSPQIEHEWGFTKDWKFTTWDSSDIWLRMKLDACVPGNALVRIVDHKTGKYYPIKAIDQGQLYAVGASIMFPDAEMFKVDFVYVDTGELKTAVYKRSMVDKFKAKFTKRVNQLMLDKVFTPKPNKFTCRFCQVKDFCQFNVEE